MIVPQVLYTPLPPLSILPTHPTAPKTPAALRYSPLRSLRLDYCKPKGKIYCHFSLLLSIQCRAIRSVDNVGRLCDPPLSRPSPPPSDKAGALEFREIFKFIPLQSPHSSPFAPVFPFPGYRRMDHLCFCEAQLEWNPLADDNCFDLYRILDDRMGRAEGETVHCCLLHRLDSQAVKMVANFVAR